MRVAESGEIKLRTNQAGGFMKVYLCVSIALLLILTTGAFSKVVTQEEKFIIKSDKLSIDLAVDGGSIHVLPSKDDRECRVSMNYPKDKCSVDVRYNDKRGALDVSIDFSKWNMEGEDSPNLILEIPSGPEISLTAHIKAGETDFELGDIRLVDFELRHWAGETTVNFAEPNRTVMRSFDVNVKIGEMTIENLGNARYEDGEINGGIGELHVDFSGQSGQMVEKCVTQIDLDLGETTLILPEDIGTKLRVSKFLSEVNYPDWFTKHGDFYYSKNYDENSKQLYLMISSGIGDLRIQLE
jgi:hypothetical protein